MAIQPNMFRLLHTDLHPCTSVIRMLLSHKLREALGERNPQTYPVETLWTMSVLMTRLHPL